MHQQGQTKGWCKVFGLAQSKGFCPFLSKFMTAFLSVFCKMPSLWVKLGIQIFQSILPCIWLITEWKMKFVVKKKKREVCKVTHITCIIKLLVIPEFQRCRTQKLQREFVLKIFSSPLILTFYRVSEAGRIPVQILVCLKVK